MNRSSWTAFGVAAAALVCAASLGCGPRHHGLRMATSPTALPAHGITVTGFGKASGPPNIARATVGVETRAMTADQAIREVNGRVAQVIAAMKQAGVAAGDLRTQNVSLQFEQNQPEPPRPMAEPARAPTKPGEPAPAPQPPQPPPGYYRATNSVEVTIRALERSGEVLGAATAAGANLILGIAFEIEDPSALEAQARQKAMTDARQRAEALATLAGRKLGPVVSVSEGGGMQPIHSPMVMMRAQAENSVPVERGELTVTTNVNVVYTFADEPKPGH